MALLVQGWTLRFRFQGKVTSFSDNLIGPDTKVSQLKQLLTAKGHICHGIAPSQLRFRGGFPPRILSLEDEDTISKNSVIRNKDMLLIELVDNSGNRIPMPPPSSTVNNHNRVKDLPVKSNLSQTKNIKATIALRRSKRERKPSERQYVLVPEEHTRPKTKKKRKQNVSGTSPSTSKHKRQVGIHTLHQRKAPSSSSKKRKFGHGKGRRIGINGEEDATAKLVSALTPGNSKDPLGQFFRYATKSAVRKQYDIARANNRFKSILLGEFEIKENENCRRLGSGNESASVKLKVRFKKGQRSWEEEEVDSIPRDALRILVQEILREQGDAGKELLKPHLMAEVSPRTFWSIVYFYGRDIPSALKTMCPDVNFQFLNERAKKLSEKALIHQQRMKEKAERARERLNKKLQREKNKHELEARKTLKIKENSDGDTITKGNQSPIPSTSDGETVQSASTSSSGARVANLVTSPFTSAGERLNSVDALSSFLSPAEISMLSKVCDINDVEALANGDAEEIFDDIEDADEQNLPNITRDKISTWIEHAREESLVYIMGRMLAIDVNHPLLTILASNGVIAPRDLSVYKAVDLHSKLRVDSVSVEDIEGWRSKAWTELGSKPWLAEYFHVDNVAKN